MNYTKHHRPIALTLLLGTLLSGAFPSHAGQDTKRWSGALCVPYGDTPSSDYAVRAEGIQNITAGKTANYRWVVCPLTRDSEEAFNLQNSAALEIRGTRSQAGLVDCMLTKGNSAMPPLTHLVQSVPFGTGNWVVLFSAAALQSEEKATLAVTCRLPPQAELSHLTYYEMTSTDYDEFNP